MPVPPNRKMGVFDAMFLLGAVAVGLSLARPAYSFVRSLPPSVPRLELIAQGSSVIFPIVAALTVSVLILGVRSSCLYRKRFSMCPGVVGCAVAAVAFLLSALPLIPDVIKAINGPYYRQMLINIWLFSSQWTGIAVLSAWTVLLLSGRWRSERSWIDRSGCVLGWCWIAAYAFCVVFHWAQLF